MVARKKRLEGSIIEVGWKDNISGDKILQQVDEYIEYFLKELKPSE